MKRKLAQTQYIPKQQTAPKKRALAVSQQQIRQAVRKQAETKYFDTFKGSTAIPASTDWTATEVDPATGNSLFFPVEGSDINDRIGRKVEIHAIKLTGFVSCAAQADQTAGDTPCVVRVIVYQDKQTNGAQAQGENVMTSSANASVNPTTFMNLETLGRFQIIKSFLFTLQNPNMTYDGTNIETQGIVKTIKMNHTFKKPVVVHYNNTNAGTIADVVDNSFHVIATCSSATLVPSIHYSARVSYKDF